MVILVIEQICQKYNIVILTFKFNASSFCKTVNAPSSKLLPTIGTNSLLVIQIRHTLGTNIGIFAHLIFKLCILVSAGVKHRLIPTSKISKSIIAKEMS
jgi:hypothetical protein